MTVVLVVSVVVLTALCLLLALLAGYSSGEAAALERLRPERQLRDTLSGIQIAHQDGVAAVEAAVQQSADPTPLVVEVVTPEEWPADMPPRPWAARQRRSPFEPLSNTMPDWSEVSR